MRALGFVGEIGVAAGAALGGAAAIIDQLLSASRSQTVAVGSGAMWIRVPKRPLLALSGVVCLALGTLLMLLAFGHGPPGAAEAMLPHVFFLLHLVLAAAVAVAVTGETATAAPRDHDHRSADAESSHSGRFFSGITSSRDRRQAVRTAVWVASLVAALACGPLLAAAGWPTRVRRPDPALAGKDDIEIWPVPVIGLPLPWRWLENEPPGHQ